MDCTGIRPTCPDIDSAISTLESLRDENERLRNFGVEQYDRSEDLENDVKSLEIIRDDQNSEIEDLRNQVFDLEEKIKEMEQG